MSRHRSHDWPPAAPFDPYEAASIALARALQSEANAKAMQEYQDHLVALELSGTTSPRPPPPPLPTPASPPAPGALLQELLALQSHQDHLVALAFERDPNLEQPPPNAADFDDAFRNLHVDDHVPAAAPHANAAAFVDPDNMTYEQLLELDDRVRDVRKERWRAIAMQVISRLPSHAWTSRHRHGASCVVCLNAYAPGDVLVTLPCTHAFHGECLTQWARDNNRCPLCNLAIQTMPD